MRRIRRAVPARICPPLWTVTAEKRSRLLLPFLLLFPVSCSRLESLTPERLQSAEQQWSASRPGLYRLVVEMKGDRVEASRLEVTVHGEEVVSIRRNGQVILPGRGQDYSMEGLFRMLHQELDLAANPSLLGAPPGYSSYPLVRFDRDTGRLVKFQRTIGGAQNSIEIDVLDFQALGQDLKP